MSDNKQVFFALSHSAYCSSMTLRILHEMFVARHKQYESFMSYSLVIYLNKNVLTFAFAFCQHDGVNGHIL